MIAVISEFADHCQSKMDDLGEMIGPRSYFTNCHKWGGNQQTDSCVLKDHIQGIHNHCISDLKELLSFFSLNCRLTLLIVS